jgi:ketosteroid isomerase-like protein
MAQPDDLGTRLASLFESYAKDWTSGNIDAFLSHWTADAIFWPPDGAELKGRDAIRAWSLQLGDTANLIAVLLHAERLQDAIFIVGDFTQDVTLQAQVVHFRGGFTSILHDTAQGLKVHRMVSFVERAVPR